MSKLLKMDIDADEGALLHTTTAFIAAGEMSNHPRRSKSRSWVAACATAQTSGKQAWTCNNLADGVTAPA